MGISCRIGKCDKFLDLGLKIEIKKELSSKNMCIIQHGMCSSYGKCGMILG